MGSLPWNVLLFLLPTCFAWNCNLNEDSMTGEEQALCFLTLLRNYRERLNDVSREGEFSSEAPDNANEEGIDFGVEDDVDVISDDDEDKMAFKRGKLDQNFLRFGRYAVRTPYSDKRAALDRNFLRFGRSTTRSKRAAEVASGPGTHYTSYKSENNIPSHRSLHLVKGMISPEKLHLMREYSRKRGALERNFLRFGRSEEQRQDHEIEKRAALDRNFLRFGRRDGYEKKAALDRNFLRFGRDPHREHTAEAAEGNFPELKRAALDRNFLRFGKSDPGFDHFQAGEKDEGSKRAALDRNFLRFGRNPAKRAQLDRNFLRFGRGNWETDTSEDVGEEKKDDAIHGLMPALQEKRNDDHEDGISKLEEHEAEEKKMGVAEHLAKRGALDKNFLRFGRQQSDLSAFSRDHYRNPADSSKRAASGRGLFTDTVDDGRVEK